MVKFECPRVIQPLLSLTFRVLYGLSFPFQQEKGNAACGLLLKGKFNLPKMGWFCGLQVALLEGPWVIHPLVSLTFGVHCSVSLSLHAGKGKCCMWLGNKMEIHFAKMCYIDCIWSNLNALESHTPWSHSLLGFIIDYHLFLNTCYPVLAVSSNLDLGCVRLPYDCKTLLNAKYLMRWRSLSTQITVPKIYSMHLCCNCM